MSDYKEFEGKSLDEAIAQACAYYDEPREKLELEIIQDAKSGLFGLVGARPALLRARVAQLPTLSGKGRGRNQRQSKNAGQNKDMLEKSQQDLQEEAEDQEAWNSFANAEDPAGQADLAASQANSYNAVEAASSPEDLGDQSTNTKTSDSQPADSKAGEQRQTRGRNQRQPKGQRQSNPTGQQQARSKDSQAAAQAEAQAGSQERSEEPSRQDKRQNRTALPRQGRGPLQNEGENGEDSDSRRPKQPRGRDKLLDGSGDKPTRPPRAPKEERPEAQDSSDVQEMGLPHIPLAKLDQEKLLAAGRECILHLISPIVGEEMPLEIRQDNERLLVNVAGDDTGLLIGREGQNLAAVQYLAERIISRVMGSHVRVQVDAGDYHSRQDARLRELAQSLADKVRAGSRSLSTKPLSAYQRRVIHLQLQDDPEIITRSAGDGALKRVIIMRRKETAQD